MLKLKQLLLVLLMTLTTTSCITGSTFKSTLLEYDQVKQACLYEIKACLFEEYPNLKTSLHYGYYIEDFYCKLNFGDNWVLTLPGTSDILSYSEFCFEQQTVIKEITEDEEEEEDPATKE